MPEQMQNPKPPPPVLAAVVIYALLAAGPVLLAIVMVMAGRPAGALFALVAFLPGMTALGLWQGNYGAKIVAILMGFATLALGIVMICLLVAPKSARAWFLYGPDLYEEPDDIYE
ncbi:hypothetical protein ACFYZ2_04665 [Streptomyces sviceus]|uniref:hypothetical protein n=1 Tax=Streptomyces sviceus TaxID=285530 RepID=UPI00368F46EE